MADLFYGFNNKYSILFGVALGILCILTYTITYLRSSSILRSFWRDERPPLAPYYVPFLKHAIAFFWDTGVVGKVQKSVFVPEKLSNCVYVENHTKQSLAYRTSPSGVVGLQFFTTRLNFVTGSDNVAKLWRLSELDANAVTCFSLKNFFSTSEKSMKVYVGDTSGVNPKPHVESNFAPKDRYYYQNRRAIVGFFNGPGLTSMGDRFSGLLTKKISQIDIGHEWTSHEDLHRFIQNLLIGPAVEAFCGPVLLNQNPTFGDEFWKMDHDMYYFFKGFPRWLAPRAYLNRSKLLRSVRDWHSFARDNFHESCIESDGHDPFYGSPLMRRRQDYLSQIKYFDADSLASQDLGLLWAENANSIPAVFWMIYEALQQPDILSHALTEVAESQSRITPDMNASTRIDSLCSIPLLQSMYAETLRLYTSLFSLRSASHASFTFCDFKIPKDELVAVDSRVAAMDSNAWNTGTLTADADTPHPLNRFWAERFLVFPDDPTSGPLRVDPAAKAQMPVPESSAAPHSHNGKASPRFSMDGLAGAWVPYGGGNRQCPGRNFAKQEIIMGFAIVLSTLEIELADKETHERRNPDMKYYGLGTLPPKGTIPFRVRRRERKSPHE